MRYVVALLLLAAGQSQACGTWPAAFANLGYNGALTLDISVNGLAFHTCNPLLQVGNVHLLSAHAIFDAGNGQSFQQDYVYGDSLIAHLTQQVSYGHGEYDAGAHGTVTFGYDAYTLDFHGEITRITATTGESDFYSNSTHISSAPEPETYAMMLVGLALLGGINGRRTRNTAAT